MEHNEFIDWRRFLKIHTKRFIYLINNNINLKSQEITALIFNDTLIEKTGKKIEKASRVNNHVSNRFILGYKLLVCGFWDGASFIPIDFSLHSEKGRKQEKLIWAYHKDANNVEKQRKEIEAFGKTISKNTGELAGRLKKYQVKSNKINILSYEGLAGKIESTTAPQKSKIF
ncbi:MAG: hypothetical protein L3J11_03675 [Draconibacterium sp.]|nr:hypothetical protein [Draconibacterium sp.]